MTPLHWAVEQEHPDVIALLLENGADPNALSKFQKTPVSLAYERGRTDFVNLLQQNRDFVNVHPHPSPHHEEMEQGSHNIVKIEQTDQEDNHEQELQQRYEIHQPLHSQSHKVPPGKLIKKIFVMIILIYKLIIIVNMLQLKLRKSRRWSSNKST